jgi:hypothetical protein
MEVCEGQKINHFSRGTLVNEAALTARAQKYCYSKVKVSLRYDVT